jgi:hypothetical protein
VTDDGGSLPVIELANLTPLTGGRAVEWEAVGSGEPLLWFEGGPGSRRTSHARTSRSSPIGSAATS